MRKFCLAALFLLMTFPVHAQDYAKADWPSLAKTLVRFGAIKLSDDHVLDEYAAITECDLYKAFYHDDFKWNQVRAAIKEDARDHIALFPTGYTYVTDLQLDRYDFQKSLFRFTAKSKLYNVNTFIIYSVEGTPCPDAAISAIPRTYRVVLDTPFSLEGLPLASKDGEALLQQMKDSNNDSRTIRARFNLHVVYVAPLYKDVHAGSVKDQAQAGEEKGNMRLDARLDSVDFFEDQDMTKLIYKFQP